MQLVHVSVPVPFSVEDLRERTPVQQEEAVKDWVESEKQKHFDWAIPPLLRFHVHIRSDDTFQLTMTEHHAILDGWSVASLLTELFQTYFSLLNKTTDPVEPPRPGSFRDFVVLERSALASEECRNYWHEKLSDSTFAALPRWSASDPSADGPTNHVFYVPISLKVSEALKLIARSERIPLKNVLLAAHLKVMSLLSGQRDVVTGLLTHGRPEGRESERTLGLFLNTVPFRQALHGGTWAELARQTFEAEREFIPFRYYQMAQIQRDQGGRPLFETVFNFTNFHVFQSLEELGDLEVLEASLFAETNLTFWANFSMSTSSPLVNLTLNADGNQLSSEQMEAISGYYARALEQMAFNPHHDYTDCDLLSAGERNRLLVEWNDTAAEYPHADSFIQLFENQVERTPDSVAVVSAFERLTYRQLNHRANQVAHQLRRMGVRAETRVGICVERSELMIIGLLGILKAGGAYVPLDPEYPTDRLSFMVDDGEIGVLVTQASLENLLSRVGLNTLSLNREWEAIAEQSEVNLGTRVEAENIAYVIYTSGSTGVPKGVQITHGALLNFLQTMREEPGLESDDVLLAVTTLSFDIAGLELYLPLLVGARVVLATGAQARDVHALRQLMEDQEVTVMQATPATWRMLIESGWEGERKIKVLCGGEALPPELSVELQRRSESVWNVYGPTETTIWSALARVKDTEGKVVLGKPIGNTSAYVLDSGGRVVPLGVAGELHLGGKGLARGYLNRPALTAEKFVPDPYSNRPGARLYRTGDLARYLSDGSLEFLGRIDHQVKIRGFRIELGEVEAMLSKQAGVREAVVLACGQTEKRLVSYVVRDAESPLTADQLRSGLREKLPDYMVPSLFVFLDSIPRTPNGKIDRRALQQLEPTAHRPERHIVRPRDLLEIQLVQIWENIFNTSPISITDNFFDLGGHSLIAIRLVAQVRDKLKQTLSLSSLVQGASIESLASLMRQRTDLTLESPVVAIQPAGSKTPFFCIHPIGGNIFCYMELARLMDPDRPFYGIQANVLSENGDLDNRIEGMAAHYIQHVRAIQPEGPYFLGGWSFGGVVAFEMARQLKHQDQQVAQVTLLDTWAPLPRQQSKQYEPDSAEMLLRFVDDFAGLSGKVLDVQLDHLRQLDAQSQLKFVLDQAIKLNLLRPDMEISQFASLFEIFERNARAFLAYAPPPLELGTRVILFRASEGKDELRDGPTLGWDQICMDGIEIRHVPGHHYTILGGASVRTLAEELNSRLDIACGAA
jgi:amino acid adenylation domain-containing protein